MTAANWITLSRIALIPVFMVTLSYDTPVAQILSLIIFIFASLTDGIDGYVARRFNQVTTFGKFIDPLADKLLVTTAIVYFVQDGRMRAWAAVIILTREFVVTSLRMVAASEGHIIAAGPSGKIKMVVQIICISFLLTPLYEISMGPFTAGQASVLLMVAVTVWSGIDYIVRHKGLIWRRK